MDDFASVVTGAAGLVAGVRTAEGRALSGMVWQDGVVVVSEQGLKDSESYRVFLPGGGEAAATLVGRDKGTNVAVLRAKGARGSMIERAEAAVGGFAVALGSDGAGGVTARLGVVHRVGPEWHSMGGGRIDRLIVLDARVAWHEEGGPGTRQCGARARDFDTRAAASGAGDSDGYGGTLGRGTAAGWPRGARMARRGAAARGITGCGPVGRRE